MRRLNFRLTKLEELQGASKQGSKFIIQRQLCRREGDELHCFPAYAYVLHGTSRERMVFSEGESEEAFDARVNEKVSGSESWK